MNIELFIARRKEKGYSQLALCEGICTQATLSRFENNGKIPSIKILIQLCKRLDLELGELFGTDGNRTSPMCKEIEQAEFSLIVEEFEQTKNILSKINTDNFRGDNNFLMLYFYLKGYVEILDSGNISEAIFDFNQILTELDKENNTIFTLLAWAGLGLAYEKNNDLEKSEYYFSKVFNHIYEIELSGVTTIWRYINIVFRCAEYYSNIKEYNTSDELINYGLKLCRENRVTYYVARLEMVRVKNLVALKGSEDEIIESLNIARVFAKFNNNQNLLTYLAEYTKNIYNS